MSFDLNLPTTCNHRIYRELTLLDSDGKSLRISKPLGASTNTDVFASDNLISRTLYNIVYDPETIAVNQPRMIQFKEKWKSPSDFFEISYTTIRSFCPKCTGLEVLDDISYDVRGRWLLARDEKLLLQNLEKFTVTEITSNPFHNFVGTSLVSLLGKTISDIDFLVTQITQEINNSLKKLSDLQSQYIFAGRTMTDGEILDTVENIDVTQDQKDLTVLRADITVTAKSGKSVEYSQFLKITEA